MQYKEILLTVEDRIATITFNRPEAGNAFGIDVYPEVIAAVKECEDRDDVRVIVLTGKGKNFSAGGDIRRFKMLIETKQYLHVENIQRAGQMAATVRRCSKPVIAMVNGAAAGAGCSVALACDFRVVTPKSKLIMSFIKMGLSGDTGGLYYLQKLVGVAKAEQLMMTGDIVMGEEACALGMASYLADDDKLAEETYRLAKRLAKGPAAAFARQKALISEFFFADLDAYTVKEGSYMAECSRTADFEEAVNAFLGKRESQFKGC